MIYTSEDKAFYAAKSLMIENGDLVEKIGKIIDSHPASKHLTNNHMIRQIVEVLRLNLTKEQMVQLWNYMVIVEDSPFGLIVDKTKDQFIKWFQYLEHEFQLIEDMPDYNEQDRFVTAEVDFVKQTASLGSSNEAFDLVDINSLAMMIISNM